MSSSLVSTTKPQFRVGVKSKQVPLKGLYRALLAASGLMKELMGVANNAAWLVCLDAYDELKKLPNWRKRTKGGDTVAQCFRKVFKEFHSYERNLIYDTEFGFFDIKGFSENVRRMYGDITNREYYDFWASIGSSTYVRTRPFISSLQNKYRLALIHGGIDEETAKLIGWGMCACGCLNSAVTIYYTSLDMIHEEFGLPRNALDMDFHMFNLKDVSKLWEDAVRAASPKCFSVELSDVDDKNVNDGLKQIMSEWTEGKGIYDDMEKTIRDCGEDVMKSQGFIKKAIDEINDLRKSHEKA